MDAVGLANWFLLHAELCDGQSLALACRAQRDPTAGGSGDVVVEAELSGHALEIFHVHPGCKALAAARAHRSGVLFAFELVQLDCKLRRALKDVEELAERKIQKSGDDGYGVEYGEESV